MSNELQNYLFHQGTNYNSYDYLGAHITEKNGESGVLFRVWAPNAKSVSVIGDFNNWNETLQKMQKINNSGVWELFVLGANEYDSYKYAITTSTSKVLYKADPYAFHAETPPKTASKVYNLNGYNWSDNNYFENLKDKNPLKQPINIYEVNLASWKRHEDGSYYSYKELKESLVNYVKEMNYTHVEFMPLSEYPFDGSWGYQVTGYFAITSRFGTPKEFMELVDAFHKENIGVILDWVPAHFPKDAHGLMEFDGKPLYENQGKDRQENKGWGTRLFDYGREEIQSFLVSSAIFLFDKFHIDGLRVDAVASMLYLDYDKNDGEWVPNIYGNNKNLEAIAFFHKLNKEVFSRFPYALMMAEESTADVKITGTVDSGGLGFNFKWNMGWMNDVLSYVEVDPYFRKHHHNKLTFSMMYAFNENFILPISHDEVVHGKKSLLNKMPGEYEDKFASNRAFLGYMLAHPGKKLTFMGEEFGQFKEWNYSEGLEFFMLQYPLHKALQKYYKDANAFYKNSSPLYSIDDSWEGFTWLNADDKDNNILSFVRKGEDGSELVVIISFNGIDVLNYKVHANRGKYKIVFNSDDSKYGGNNKIKKKVYQSTQGRNDKKQGFYINIPKLSCIYLSKIK
ncbi:MAG: 1,4-alpha-glucan branching protein GlgB [Clostridia bacterium]|nr:1,4-alpha-glucan branching protein GlgB [Clostridia bacterium]